MLKCNTPVTYRSDTGYTCIAKLIKIRNRHKYAYEWNFGDNLQVMERASATIYELKGRGGIVKTFPFVIIGVI